MLRPSRSGRWRRVTWTGSSCTRRPRSSSSSAREMTRYRNSSVQKKYVEIIVLPIEYISLQEIKQGQCICPPVLRIRDVYPDPGSWFLPIPDPGSKNSNKREGWKIICCHKFLCSHKFHKIAHYFSFDVLKKKIWASFQRIIELFTQKIVNKLSELWIWDPGSGKNLFRIPDPGVKKAPDPGSATLLRILQLYWWW